MSWNFDMSAAPLGETTISTRIIKGKPCNVEHRRDVWLWLALPDGKVQKGHWVPANKFHNGYWAGLPVSRSVEPVAWQHVEPAPVHPYVFLEQDKIPAPAVHQFIIDDVGGMA